VNVTFQAMLFARQLHNEQRHPITDSLVTQHLAEISAFIASIGSTSPAIKLDTMVATCWLAYSLDLRSMAIELIRDRFNPLIAQGVLSLSKVQPGELGIINQVQSIEQYCSKLANAATWVQSIKAVDILVTLQYFARLPVAQADSRRALLLELMTASQHLPSVDSRIGELLKSTVAELPAYITKMYVQDNVHRLAASR
jgi:(p)ppGpp synthase/HD superfamily hydrolase